MLESDVIYNENCFKGLLRIPDRSIDGVFIDPPYEKTRLGWDKHISLDLLWSQLERVAKDDAVIAIFADGRYAAQLITSNPKNYRYKYIWIKNRSNNFLNAKTMPLICHEEILIFYRKLPTYNPQMWYSTPYKAMDKPRAKQHEISGSIVKRDFKHGSEDGRRYPRSILSFPHDRTWLHPTQKPEALMEHLIKTYTNEGDIVLDCCFGSGSTLVAAKKSGRRYVGFEQDRNYFTIARMRLDDTPKAA